MDDAAPILDLPEFPDEAWGQDSWEQALDAFAAEIPGPESDNPLGDLIASIDADIAAGAPDAPADLTPRPEAIRRGSLVFSVSGERYAAPVERVVRLDRLGAVTPTPNTPAWVLGVTNVRGEIVPVLDLRRLLGLPAAPSAGARRLVQLKGPAPGLAAGVVVDGLHGIRSLEEEEPASGRPQPLDVDGLFNSAELRELMEGTAG